MGFVPDAEEAEHDMIEPVEGSSAHCPRGRAFLSAVLATVMLSACGKEDSKKEPSPDQGQTIARVNGQEITEHELEVELKELGPLEPEERPAMAREVLRRLVQRTILAQKAEEANLHRTPEIMMELRRERAETLARAYIEDGLARQLPISKYDVEDFIDQYPYYFKKRKHYIFDQLLIDNDLMTEEVKAAIKYLTTLEEVEATLNEMGVKFSRRLNANLSSQFPREAIVKIDALEPGEVFLTQTREHTVISKLLGSRQEPVSGEEARRVAIEVLTTRRDAVATRRIIDSLLTVAKVEFLGSFADTPLFSDDGFSAQGPEDEAGEQEAAAQKTDAKGARDGTKKPAR